MSNIEQLPIDINILGLKESITGGSPFMCVIPSCMGKTYREVGVLRTHYSIHDPEMYSYLVCPVCKFTAREDRPKQMKKHVMANHGIGMLRSKMYFFSSQKVLYSKKYSFVYSKSNFLFFLFSF